MRISEMLYPRIVCLITSISKDGKPNVMTASFVMPISFEPKYLAISISPMRHTFQNIQEMKEFGVNVCSEEMKEIAKICGSYSGKEFDKFNLAKIKKENGKIIKAPLIKECPISLECEVEEIKPFGDHFLIVGKVLNEKIRKKDFRPLLHKTKNEWIKIA